MDAFAEIEVTPLYSKDGMRSQGHSVRIRGDDGWEELGVVSPNYLLVHNSRVKEVLDHIAERSKITDWQQRRLFFDGRRFVYSLTTDNITAEVSPGDVVRFGLIAYNSYDGSRALSVGAYAEHLVCANGMTSDAYFARFVFRHHQGNLNWDEATQEAFQAVMSGSRGKLVRFAGLLYRLKRKDLTLQDLAVVRKEHLGELSSGIWGKVMDRFLGSRTHNGFELLDACTRVFWHNEKQTYSDYRNNSYATDALVQYAEKLRN